MPTPIFCFDIESNGLHGDGFAVGVVKLDAAGEVALRWFARTHAPRPCEPWVAANVMPHLPTRVDHSTVRALRGAFWDVYTTHAPGALVIVDTGWPVEARWLAACIDDAPARAAAAPWPLFDVSSLCLAAGIDPKADRSVLLPDSVAVAGDKHDPVYDAEVSARAAYALLKRMKTNVSE